MKLTNSLITIALLLSIILPGTGCLKKEALKNSNQCDTSNTAFNQLYNSILSTPGFENDTTMDLPLHAYTFQVNAAATICKIGYQNLSPTNTKPYLIEIYDSAANTLLYSGSHLFSSTATSYISINPLILTPGKSYTIKRIQNATPLTSDLIGRLVRNLYAPLPCPITSGNLKITSSSFSNSQYGWTTNFALPYIDIVFQ